MPRSVSLRYLRFREEVAFGQSSALNPHTVAYGNFSLRKSMPTGPLGEKGHGAVRRNVQLTGPLNNDGRYAIIPDLSQPNIFYSGDAQKALWDSWLKRKYSPTSFHHPRTSLGDLRSFELDAVGPSLGESTAARGCKSTGFQITTQRRGIINILQFAAQYSASVDVDSAWDGDNLDNKIYIRNEPGYHHLESSAIRVRKVADGPIDADPGGSLLKIPTSLRIGCSRPTPPRASLGEARGGIATEREERVEDEEWRIGLAVETDNDALARQLVADIKSNSVLSRRWNLRVDIGLNNGVLYVERPWLDSVALVPAMWGFPQALFNTDDPAHPEYKARAYGVYAKDLGNAPSQPHPIPIPEVQALLGSQVMHQYAPRPGDTIRHQGYQGPLAVQTDTAEGTYVATVGSSRVLGTYFGPRILHPDSGGGDVGAGGPPIPLPPSVNFTVVPLGGSYQLAPPKVQLFPPQVPPSLEDSGWPLPDYIVSFYTTDALAPSLTTDSFNGEEQWVPGGMTLDFENVTVLGSEGLSNDDSSHQFTFSTDQRSTVRLRY